MKKNRTIIPFITALIFIVISLGFSFDAYCLEASKKATWIKPLEKAVLSVGKYTYEYIADSYKMYEGTFRILEGNKVLFTDKVGGASEGVSWTAEPKFLEPFQMIIVNPKDPPVVFFYNETGRYHLEIRIYSTAAPKLLDVLDVGEVGAEIKDIDNDGILEFEAENYFQLPLPPINDTRVINDIRAIYHFSKNKFKLVKGGEFKSIFLNWAEESWQAFEKVYKQLIAINKRGEDWDKIREKEKHYFGSYRVMIGNLAKWLAHIESTSDQIRIEEALEKLRRMPFLSEKERKELIECLVKAGYSGLALKK